MDTGDSEDKLPEVLKDLVSKKYLTTKRWRDHARGYHKRFVTKSTFHRSIRSSTYSLAATIDHTEKSDTRSQSELDDICILAPSTNTTWYDRDGIPVLRYFPRMVSHRLSQQVRQELKSFIRIHPLRIPNESRHNDTSTDPSEPPRKKPRHRLQSAVDIGPTTSGTSTRSTITASTVIRDMLRDSPSPPGRINMTLYHAPGHWHEAPTFSADFIGQNVGRTNAALSFRRSDAMTRLCTFICGLFMAIDPTAYAKYRTNYVEASKQFPLLADIDKSPINCFVGYYILVNVLTFLHCDTKEPPDGWVIMVVFGGHTGAELCVPDLGISLPYKDADVVFMRSWALRHFIRQFTGDRYVFVFSTSKSIFDWIERMRNQ
jgi:hypothetical protein